jgi:hypothetical protein
MVVINGLDLEIVSKICGNKRKANQLPISTYCFNDANSRETYFTLHNVRTAHQYSKGKGVKVGVIDWLFGLERNKSLYAGVADISGNPEQQGGEGHGLWMTTTLRETAPECEIYALNAISYESEDERLRLLEKAIDWAIDNKLDILTYSHAAFNGENRTRVNEAVKKAVKTGLVTTFIHNDAPHNIYPYACYSNRFHKLNREPDVNILHFDYNVLREDIYQRYTDKILSGQHINSGDYIPFFSLSSMSPVLGGFVALMKAIRPTLTADEYKRILKDTSYSINQPGEHWYDIGECERVVDIGRAVELCTTTTSGL